MAAAHVADSQLGATPATAARIARVSQARLRAWWHAELIEPSLVQRVGVRKTVRIYGFNDLVAMAVVRELESRCIHIVKIKHLCQQAQAASDVERPLSELNWATSGGSVYVQYAEGAWGGEPHLDQLVMRDVIEIRMVQAEVRSELTSRRHDTLGQIKRVRGLHRSRPVISGTGVSVDAVASYLSRGHSDDDIFDAYPQLTPTDLRAVKRHLAS